MTNYERIHSKTIEELAQYMKNCDVCCPPMKSCPTDECVDCWLEWLRSEANEHTD